MSPTPTEKPITKLWPDAEYRYFLFDPEGDGHMYFWNAADRDAAAKDAIQAYLDDSWSEEVERIIAGEITHHAVARNVETQPKREECDSDEDYSDAMDDWGDADCSYKCNYELAPIADPGEQTP